MKLTLLSTTLILGWMLLLPTGATARGDVHADPWAAEIAHFEALDRASPPRVGGIVFVGSSSIRMWATLREDFPGRNVINRGFGGSNIRDAIRYSDRIVLPYQPRKVILYAGDNDTAEGRSADQILSDFKTFVAHLRQRDPGIEIAFISIKPSPARASLIDVVRAANEKIHVYANSQRRISYIAVFTPMLGADGKPRAELFGPDLLHMNGAGYALWTRTIAPWLAK